MTFKNSQNGKLILKLEQEAAIRVQSVVRMSLQSIYQILVRNYIGYRCDLPVASQIMFERYVLKSLSTLSIDFRGKRF